MKPLIQFLLIVMVAVVLTVFAQGNDSRVLLSVSTKRIELSLNLAIVLLLMGFLLFHYSLLALRFSVQLTTRFKDFFSNRKQKALLQANTNALIAWITEDEQESHRALQQAISTGIETDISYFIRALFCLQAHQWDEAEQVLSTNAAQQGKHAFAAHMLRVKIALAKGDHEKALELLDELDVQTATLPLVRKQRALALQHQIS